MWWILPGENEKQRIKEEFQEVARKYYLLPFRAKLSQVDRDKADLDALSVILEMILSTKDKPRKNFARVDGRAIYRGVPLPDYELNAPSSKQNATFDAWVRAVATFTVDTYIETETAGSTTKVKWHEYYTSDVIRSGVVTYLNTLTHSGDEKGIILRTILNG